MKVKDINRVVIGVKDMDKGMEFYSKLLNITFYEVDKKLAGSFGARVAISWEGKIELVCPLPGRDSGAKGLLEHKEGLLGVIFNVDDADEARRTAEEMGVGIKATVEMNPEQIETYHQDRFKKFKEYFLNAEDTGNVSIILGQIEEKEKR
jgi:predicted enzyme related to lactoylglutathione lyase